MKSYKGSFVKIQARYSETDQGGRIYHGAYLPWLEMARLNFFKNHSIDYVQLEKKDIFIVVRKLEIEYFASAFYDNEYLVYVEKVEINGIKLDFFYRIEDNISCKIIIKAYTQLVLVNKQGKPIKIPTEIIKLF